VGLVFVTGRGLESVRPLIDEPAVPTPDYVIGDVGSSVAAGRSLERLHVLEQRLRTGWPGAAVIRQRMQHVRGLREQRVPQAGRASYVLDRPGEVPAEAETTARAFGVQILLSCGIYLDFLPPGVSKGAALRALLDYLTAPMERALVCGDTLNDLSLFQLGARGVVVGGAEEKLYGATRALPDVLHAHRPGAGGICEGVQHFLGADVQ
jgi:hydroxymethylpyrimidine pyrophosphatase-like HAD family hydrolase